MTWNPASASAGTWCRQSRPVSGNPCSSTTGRPAPWTSYSIPTPSPSTRLMRPPSRLVVFPRSSAHRLRPQGFTRYFAGSSPPLAPPGLGSGWLSGGTGGQVAGEGRDGGPRAGAGGVQRPEGVNVFAVVPLPEPDGGSHRPVA